MDNGKPKSKVSPLDAVLSFILTVKLAHLLLIIGAGFFLTLPVIFGGLPEIADDSATHAIWYTHFAEQLWAGELYPRWLQGLNGGLGGPVFFYYGPVPYYWTSTLHPLLAGDSHGLYQLGIATSGALIASGIFAYAWLKQVVAEDASLLGAILYMALPYHLAIDLYTRGAVAEFWAFVWMPLILYFVCLVRSGSILAVVGLAISYALLVMTHLPTTLMFSGVPIVYSLLTAEGQRKSRVLGLVLFGMALGLGLSAIYVFPAMMMQDFISLQRMRTGFLNYENWFLLATFRLPGSSSSLEDFAARRNILLSFTASIVTGLGGCAYFLSRRHSSLRIRRESGFWLVIALMSLFMMTPLSKPVWQLIPTLQSIQFPYRFNSVLTLAVTPLFAILVVTIKKLNGPTTSKLLVMTASLALIGFCIVAAAWRAWRAFPLTNPQPEIVGEVDQKIKISRGTSEYHPRWSEWGAPLLMEMAEQHRNPVRASLSGAGTVGVKRWRPREILLQVDAPSGGLLTVYQFYYPGWTARFVGKHEQLALKPSRPDGLLTVFVPAGRHDLALGLERSPPEYWGQTVSAVSVMIVLILFYAGTRGIAEKQLIDNM